MLDKEHISFLVTNYNVKAIKNMYPNLDYIQLKNRIIEVLNNYPSLEYQVNNQIFSKKVQ